MIFRSFPSTRWVILFLLSFFFCSESYPVWAFKVLKTAGGKEIKWHSTETVPFKINTSSGPSGSLTAIQNAMNTWSNVSDCYFGFQYSGTSNSHSWSENDGVNLIDFDLIDEISTVARNYSWYNTISGAILDSDIRFNTNQTFSTTGSSSAFDIQNIITHEFGHSLALDDLYNSSDSEITMYGFAEEGETKKRSLDQDDINGIRYLYPFDTTYPDLIVPTVTVSDSSLTPSQAFTINATVENQGPGASASTTLRYYRSTNSTISTGDTLIGTDSVSALSPDGTSVESTSATAPSSTGTYWIGACVDSVSGESDTGNNCSSSVQITVSSPSTYPDLIVPTVTVSDSSLTPSQAFTINATVENQGPGASASTTLRYYRSTNSTISTGDTLIGTDSVSALSPDGTSVESTSATAPSSTGTYWIGACVDSVSGESDTGNNCSSSVQITISDSIRMLREDFESWPPEGWNIINNGGDCVWDGNGTAGKTNYAGGSGYCADADADECGEGTTMDTELRTPALNLSDITNATFSFVSSYNNFSNSEFANVDISTDGGTTWVNLLSWHEDHHANGPGEIVHLDLTPYVGNSWVIIRFHYYAPGWYWWWQIDDVVIRSGGNNAMPWIPLLLLDE